MRSNRLAAALALALATTLIACGSSAHAPRPGTGGVVASGTADGATSQTPSPPSGAGPVAQHRPTATVPNRSGAPPPVFTATLDSACVTPGGEQTLTVHTNPSWSVTYNSTYADGRHGDTYGGRGVDIAGADGSVHASWRVDVAAPPGPATVYVGSQHGTTSAAVITARFTVAQQCP